ncbi:hypothetical protein ACTHSJ_02805 [Paenibacillus cellulositrophicus]|uniref:hypothetical protein n=1 Tax=Paenibacillus cellulositrophicus TaxID=562959 RepID=UPI003F7CFA4F
MNKEEHVLKIIGYSLLVLLLLLTGCASVPQSYSMPEYKGRGLTIGVVGGAPSVRENNVTFVTLKEADLEKGAANLTRYDAVFIMKKHVSHFEALMENNELNLEDGVPIFFLQTSNLADPLLSGEGLLRKNTSESNEFALGYVKKGEQNKTFSLVLDEQNDPFSNLENAYTILFKTIESGI